MSEIPVVPYSTFGSAELAADIESAFATGGDAVLLANHGAIAVARDLQAAAANAAILEFLACSYYRTLALGGGAVLLPPDEIARVTGAYDEYGQPSSPES